MTRTTPLHRLDHLVRWTGIPALSENPPRRRPLRWPAASALVLAFGGAAGAAATGFAGRGYWLGYGALITGFTVANIVNIFGPLKPFGAFAERVDEWDRQIRSKAYLAAFALFALTTFVGLLTLLATVVYTPAATSMAITVLMFLLMTVIAATPTAYASWRWRWDSQTEHVGPAP